MKRICLIIVLLVANVSAYAQLTVNNAVTPTQLVNNFLLGSGVTASNITFTGGSIQRSSFSCTGGCNLGISTGVLLSSGEAIAPTSPALYHHSTDVGSAGDAQLNAIVTPRVTEDAAILEFDFVVASDSVKFEYVFASEEYNDYANTNFNDVFAFFISGPGITGSQNIALIPGTATPVSINTVNNGNSGGVATGPCMNCAYFVDNVGGASVYFDGFTTVLRARAAVLPCQTYHIKLAIADAGDGIFDSGVFLEGGSFSSLGQIAIFANGVAQQNNSTVYACTGTSVDLCLNPAQNYNWNNLETTQCITVNEQNLFGNGTYQAYTYSPTGCFAFTTNVTVQFVTPTATITPSGPLDLCPGQNVTLTANVGNTYLWSNGATTQSINVTTPGTYTVTVSSGANCSAVSTPVVVTVGNAVATISGTLDICNGSNTTLTANPAQTWLWSTGDVTQSISPSVAGNYTVTVTQPGGCTASATVTLNVNPNPVPAITGTLSFCQGQATLIDAGPGYIGYSWSTGALTQTLNVTAGATYTVTVTDALGCTGTTSAIVIENALPVPAIAGLTSFCIGDDTDLDAGAGYGSYLWNTGALTQTLNVTAAGTYTVTVSNAAGCSASTSVNITVNPLPTPNIVGTFAFCQGSNTSIDAGAGYTAYLWNTGALTQTLNVTAGATYTVTVTDANGCSNFDAQLITVNANPVPAIVGINTICQGANTTFTADPGYSSYLWSTGSPAASISLNTAGTYTVTVMDVNGCTGSVSQTLTVNPLPVPAIAGTLAFCIGNNSDLNAGAGYTGYLWSTGATSQIINVTTAGNYIVTVTNNFGCTASTSALVTVNPLPTPNITGTFSFCAGSNTTLDAGAGYTGYLWNTGALSQTLTVTAGNTYTVTVTNANGCSNNDAQLVTVNANPVPTITGINSICQGASTTFTADPGFFTYLWSTGSTAGFVNLNTAGSYTVTVMDWNGCTGTVSQSLTVNPLPVPAITGVTSFCDGLNSNLDAGPGFSSYLWNTGATTQILNVTTGGNFAVTVTNGFGCSAATSTLVTVNALPVPSITGPLAICIGNTATLNAGAGYATYLWNTGESTQTIDVTGNGTYTVTVTSAAGCSGLDNASLTVNPLPVPSITGITTICQGATTTFDAGAGYSAYLWSNGATTQTIVQSTAGQYTVTVTDANGCSEDDDINLTVNALPTPDITGTTAFCDGDNSNLNAGAGYSSYLWNTGATSQVINVTTGGNFTVTVTDINGCVNNDVTLITVHPNPVPVIQGGTGICIGTSTTLDVPGTFSTYLWNTGETTQNISVNTAGNYTVTVTSAFGCIGSASTAMVINPLPTPAITGVNEICMGQTTTFDAGPGYSAYLWSNGITTQTLNTGTAGNITVMVTDANGCQNSTGVTLTVNALPVPVISGDFEFCIGDNSNINAGAGYVSYLWNDGSTSQVINVTTAGNYIVTVTDNNGCSNNTSTMIVVHQLPVPVISGLVDICQGNTTTFNAGNYVSYLWSTGETTSTISTGVAGTYTVTVTDVNGCVNNTAESLTVHQLPVATIVGSDVICVGETTSFIVNFTGTAPFTYTYSNGSTTSPAQTAPATSATVNVTPLATTTYTLMTVSDVYCAGNVGGTAMVTVNPLPEPLVTGDLSICDGENTLLVATPGFVSYNWSNASTQQAINTGTAGVYTVSVTDVNGCVGTSPAVNLVVNMVPVVAFTNDTSLTCADPVINFTNLSQYPTGSQFAWNFGDGTTSDQSNPSHIYLQPGNYPVSLEITTSAGCVSQQMSSVEIMFYPLPIADFVTAPGATNVFNGRIDFVDRSSNAVSWIWEFGDGDKTDIQNPYHYYDEIGEFKVTLTVTNIAGCIDRHEDVVTINPFYIPNAFTPNGDGINDQFYYAGYELDIQNYNMKIFNRWGQLVFRGEDSNDNWNGLTIEGNDAPQGTYVYHLEIKTRSGKDYIFSGELNLIR